MSRIEEVQKLVNKYLKDNKYDFEVSVYEEQINYTITSGCLNLYVQYEFWDEEYELKYPNEYCVIQSCVNDEENYGDGFEYSHNEIQTLDNVIDELEEALSFYKDKLSLFRQINKHLSDIRRLVEEIDCEFNEEITSFSFIR